MLKRQKTLFVTLAIAALFASGAIAGAALPSQKQATPKPQATQKSQGKLALAESEVVQLLLLMETNKNGKISEQECMKFMETEVDRLIGTTAEICTPRDLAVQTAWDTR